MIIYGTRAPHLVTQNSPSLTCPNCQKTGTISMNVYSKHFHVFWIPTFPIGKTGHAHCSHCGHCVEEKAMSSSFASAFNQLKASTKVPKWQFSGLGVIAILIAFMSFVSMESNKKELIYIADPQKGDVYEYKSNKGFYSTLKVAEVNRDSVFVLENDFETDKMTGIYKIDKSENYGLISYAISRSELQKMYDEKVIYDVNRR